MLPWREIKKAQKKFRILRRGVKITSAVCSTFLVALLLIAIVDLFLYHYQIVLHTWLLLLHFSMGPDVQLGSHDDAEEIVKAPSICSIPRFSCHRLLWSDLQQKNTTSSKPSTLIVETSVKIWFIIKILIYRKRNYLFHIFKWKQAINWTNFQGPDVLIIWSGKIEG